ncbi:hypothetical protein, partial [Bacillus pseudomycoides]|uniref:hypothetical protein n=1 Tax=Bacillus pseudomycoides TaxID=64104 RepID=UPI001C556B31
NYTIIVILYFSILRKLNRIKTVINKIYFKVNFLIFVYIQIAENIDFIPKTLISSKTTRKVYI